MESIIEQPETNLDVYGLVNPLAEIVVEKANKEIVGPLLLGKKVPGDTMAIYAKLKDKPEVFTVKSAIYDDISVKPQDLQ